MYILFAILIFGFLIFTHELGHYTVARIFGVKINEFAIGMGPKLLSKTSKKTGITYSLRLLPFGGFVSMAGEDDESEDENSLDKKPAWQRFLIMIAGSFMNLLLGVILVAVLVLQTDSIYNTTVSDFVENAYSESTGLQKEDTIIKIGKKSIHTLYDLSYTLMHDAAAPTEVTVIRNGGKVVLDCVEFPTEESDGIRFGLRDFYVYEEDYSFPNVMKQIFWRSVTTVRMIWESLFDLVTGKYGVSDLSGPVGITKTIGEAASQKDGGTSLIYLVSLIAINLGVCNLLPFPALDGFRAVTTLIEMIFGVKTNKSVEGYINLIGLALLMLLMFVVTFIDISKLFR